MSTDIALNPENSMSTDFADKALDLTQNFEKQWQKTLLNSQNKSREWLYRHAKEIYEFRQACGNKELDLPASAKQYFELKMQEWLGYSDDLARKWSRLGKFLDEINSGKRNLASDLAHRLPLSYTTLVEFSSMTDEEIQQADAAGLVHADVTNEDIRDFKALLKQADKAKQAKQSADVKEFTETTEAELLTFKYDDNIPDEIVGKIEDLVTEIGEDNVRKSPTLKFNTELPNGQATTWVCLLVKDTWSGKQYLEQSVPADDHTPPPKPDLKATTSGSSTKKSNSEQELAEFPASSRHMIEPLYILGINYKRGYVETWALNALIDAAKKMYKDDPIYDELDDIFNQLVKH